MSDAIKRTIKSTQEQAVASWFTYLNQKRLDELVEALNQQNINFEEALKELGKLKQFIGDSTHILGSKCTKHGEIAEHMQVNLSNAWRLVNGKNRNHTFNGVGRTAPEDYIRNNQYVQSKFYNGAKNTIFGKGALKDHLGKYPDFIKNGGTYDIPKDQYQTLKELLNKYQKNPSNLNRSDYNFARRLDEFLKDNNLELGKDINPSVSDYRDVQKGRVNQTVNEEERQIKKTDEKRRNAAYHESKPTLKEGAMTSGISAAIEGGVTFCLSVAEKRKEKNFFEFSVDDWKDIGLNTGKGVVQGGIRGGAIYILTNFTATPSNVASAYVTAAFGIAAQAKQLERGETSKDDFVINCETVCLDVAISAIASLVGTVAIPIPFLGAIIGNVAGEFVYELCKNYGATKSQEIINGYCAEMKQLNEQLDGKYAQFIIELQKRLEKFKTLEELAFDENVNVAFDNSIELALESGVDDSKILKTIKEIDNYFLI